ncbi:MAG: ROK family protein [Melioribacteraceae bacterium]|nr:ROK family protein [Melioribacteraceae bacterium]
MPKKKYAIGVDLGGTSIKIGLVDEKGKIAEKVSIDSLANDGPKAVVSQIKKGIKQLLKKDGHKILGIGVGSPGTIRIKKGTVEDPPNFPGWGKIHLGNLIKKEFKVEVFVENDANAAAIGELIYGAGRKYENFIMITLGTGVGGGIIINKKIYRGEVGGAGELGHVTIDAEGVPCKCGSFGCVEAYIGSNYLIERVKTELQKVKKSILLELCGNNLDKLNPQIIHEATERGDQFAGSVIIDTGKRLGYGLSNAVNIMDIATIIIGGGVAGFGELLFTSVEETLKSRVMKPFQSRVVVIPAKLKNEAGIKGASALVFYKS